ncbi:Fe-S cluster assembly protein SufD [Ferviditalea candida]|uniref:Fe-S cluster assembly protein SufD n=1 Tax=Ferviditalea candida TaxID=3108399 RepID=A0ABU5ZIV8_9BACL|nr:Fe-S cluster assembly protein SufD [Paenibacillaceae bacterium T2]
MSTQTILPVDRHFVSALSDRKKEPSWMASLRLEALELAGSLELPKLEKTRIDRWNLHSFGQYTESPQLRELSELPETAQNLLQSGEQTDNLLVQRNSDVVFHRISAELAEQGVIFTDLEEALQQHSDLLQRYFMSAVKMDENRLTALHAALWNGGVFLYVPKNVRMEVPLQALFVSDNAKASFCPHVMIIAEDNSFVTYVDNYVSVGDSEGLVHSGVVEIFAKQGAHVQFASVHNLRSSVTDLTYRRGILDNDARIDWVIGELNGGDCLSDTTSVLKGNGSRSNAKVICVGTGSQKLNVTTKAVHFGKNSDSDMITRAVMREEATAIINGITKIEKGATYANGQQTEKILMLSPQARGDANPMLLIDEDEVKAGHAASVGKVDPEQVYYMMSRGIDREQATRLIIYGFLAPIVSEIPIGKLEEQLKQLVERKLGQ